MTRSSFPRTAFSVACLTAALFLTACAGDSPGSRSVAPTKRAAVTAPAAPTYSTHYFDPPIDVVVPSWLDAAPDEDTAHFVTFASSDGSRAVRILRPVVVYRPGSSAAVPVPKDYVDYLLAAPGAHLTNRVNTTVDRHPTMVVTATTERSLDGTLGCPRTGIRPAECYGLQPEFILRVAVITTDQGPLLVWLRLNVDSEPDMGIEAERFDALLAGLHFGGRDPEVVPAAAASPLDGSYTWTLTKRDALAHGTPGDKTSESLASYPWKFTVTMAAGTWTLRGDFARGAPENDTGTYEATADHIDIHFSGTTLSYDVVRDGSGTLNLTAIPPQEAGDIYVNTTKPWTRTRPSGRR